MSTDNQRLLKQKFRRWRAVLRRVAIVILGLLCMCVCSSMVTLFTINDVYGTAVERITRYPNSEALWSGYGVYGSGDYGTKIYYRWTSDTLQAVHRYYARFHEDWHAEIVSAGDVSPDSLIVCYWVGFWRTNGCDEMQNKLPNYGTLIIFEHDYFAG